MYPVHTVKSNIHQTVIPPPLLCKCNFYYVDINKASDEQVYTYKTIPTVCESCRTHDCDGNIVAGTCEFTRSNGCSRIYLYHYIYIQCNYY